MSQPEKGSWCSPTGQSTTWPVASGIHSWKPPSAEANWRQCLGNSMVSTFIQKKKLESRETWRISLWMFVIFWWFLHMFFSILEPDSDDIFRADRRGHFEAQRDQSTEELTMVTTVGHWAAPSRPWILRIGPGRPWHSLDSMTWAVLVTTLW